MEKGVLLVAHGSRIPQWRKNVEQLVEEIHTAERVELAFLDGEGEEGIEGTLARFLQKGVDEALVIPLFVCSGSAHLEEIRSILGFGEVEAGESFFGEEKGIRLTWTEPLDDHPLIRQILRERIQQLSSNPREEVLMLVAHGSEEEGKREEWVTMVARIASSIGKEFSFAGATYATIHPDNLRKRALLASRFHRLIVVPLFICSGYYTGDFIPKQLEGVNHQYDGRSYLPHPNVVKWVEETIKSYR